MGLVCTVCTALKMVGSHNHFHLKINTFLVSSHTQKMEHPHTPPTPPHQATSIFKFLRVYTPKANF